MAKLSCGQHTVINFAQAPLEAVQLVLRPYVCQNHSLKVSSQAIAMLALEAWTSLKKDTVFCAPGFKNLRRWANAE